MPAFSTHYLFLDDLAQTLRENADFDFNFDAAAIGTQGPDIFFFHKIYAPFSSRRSVARALHRAHPADIFDAFADYCAFSPNIDIAKSYMYGFILHYALDRKCHPFVYSLQERILEKNNYLHKSSAHSRIEHAMDTYMLSVKKGISNPSDFDNANTIKLDFDIMDEVTHLLSFVIPRATRYNVSEEEVAEAICDTKKVQKILRDKSGRLFKFCKIVEKILAPIIHYYKFSANINPKDLEKAKKYGNINKTPWFSPFDKGVQRTDSFEELFESSKEDAISLICGFDKLCKGYLSGKEITNNISFLTGIEV